MDRRSSITPRDLERMLCDETAEPKALPLSLLEEITNDFSDEQQIGIGGFAVVYKGKLESRAVAVKRMFNTYMYEKEFQREVECLMMVKHKNVVRFLGYCVDTQGSMARHERKFIMAEVQQRLLCFEYLSNGSLHENITDASSGLQWRHRYQIINGICHGLHYLHQSNIVHLDLKPGNILLDANLVAKIADFSLSRCFDDMRSRVKTVKIGGTLGYLAPEFCNGEITYQFDIYSLGVIIMEILTGKKGYHAVDKVVESWSNMLEKSQIDVQLKQVRVCAEIGIECIDPNPAKRPDAQHIIDRLDETKSMDEYIETGVITSQQINPDMLNGAMHAFWLSYQQLNPDMRRCIEYCSIFPKGSTLGRDKLVCMWIAQGFVKTNCATEDIEDVAEGYIHEFVSCSFLQLEKTWSHVDFFAVHDVLHDLLDMVVGNCFRIENARSQRGDRWEGNIPRDVQHLFVQKYDAELITEKILGLENLHTLIIDVVERDTRVENNIIESVCKRLSKLRVLAIAFSEVYDPVMQPTDLINLRHIICGPGMGSPNNIGRLISLQTIPKFIVSDEQGRELKQLRDLNDLRGNLQIYCLENVKSKEEALEANLAGKERLTKLSLAWDEDGDTRCNPEVEAEVLEGLCPPVGLQEMYIWDYKGSWYPDWMVGKQNGGPKHLQELHLSTWGQLGPAPELVEAFPRLRVLGLYSCRWDALPGNIQHLTSLRKLQIVQCSNIRSLPTLPRSLEEFVLVECDDELMESCTIVGHPNWQKIEYIPSKKFR